jgi:hypothetical protein
MKKVLFPILALVLALGLALPMAAPALAAAPVPGSTTISLFPNPATLSGDSATDVTITTTTTSSAGQPYIDEGKVTIQLATDGSGNPVPAASVVTWVALNSPGQSPASGVTTLDVDLDGLGFVSGTAGGFQAHYVTGGGSTKVAEHFSDPVDLTAEGAGGGADTEAPTVDIDVSDTMISEADAGGTFDVIATFSEAMDTSFTPTISFDPNVAASGTLTFSSGAWSAGDTVYTATYNVADEDEEVAGVDVSVGGAKDLAENLQDPDPTTEADLFDVDTVAPVINISAPVGEYYLNEPVYADWDVTDEGSGVNWAETYGTVASGDPIDTSVVGGYDFYVYAEDNAGNHSELTALYSVVYDFGGFLPPLVINGQGNGLFKAGSTIPVKFQLFDYYGNPVSTATGTASINTTPLASADIRYDATAMQYIANLKTPKGAALGPYTITVSLNDGTTHTIGVTLK